MSLPSPEAIVARIEAVHDEDFWGAQSQELLSALDFDSAKPLLKDTATPKDWKGYPLSEEKLRAAAKEYFSFAIDRARSHRGLSASRSIDHYKSWVWLLANDRYEEFAEMDHAQYGVPQLKFAAEVLGFPEMWDAAVAADLKALDTSLINMAEGKPCMGGCPEGCSA